jgi:hypothetical protein
MISCLCVTRNRVDLLSRAVNCFQSQSYEPRELLVVYESDDADTREYLRCLGDPAIRPIEVPVQPKLTLGALRNLAVENSDGALVCQWDDDDWYRYDRLEVQLRALQESGRPACVLSRWTCLDVPRKRAYIGCHRTWEGSILCEKAELPEYPDLPKFEDTPVIEALQDDDKLLLLDRPEVYVYHFHGGNTWDRRHWQDVIHGAKRMKASSALKLMETTGADCLPIDICDDVPKMIMPTKKLVDEIMQREGADLRESHYLFAGQPVRMRVAGAALADHMESAFAQLRTDEALALDPVLSIDSWDWQSTGSGCPGIPFPPDTTELLDNGILNSYAGGEVIRYERGHYVTTLDLAHGQLFSCRRDGTDLALYERAKPFDMMLQRWYLDQGVQQIHAGLVAKDGLGVLFVGDGGSGKSTCTLACALAGFDYLGDDHNGLEFTEDGEFIGHSLYDAARITPDHLTRFPELAKYQDLPHSVWDHKGLVLMSKVPNVHTVRQTRIVAVVIPNVRGRGDTTFRKASKVQTLIALAPSSLRGPLNAGYSGFTNLIEFIPQMPCFRLEIGESVTEIPPIVDAILDEPAVRARVGSDATGMARDVAAADR